MKREVISAPDFGRVGAEFISAEARRALRERDRFRIALAGGNTPRQVYAELAREKLPWDKCTITFGDERCVPPDDAQSNFRMASETLLGPAGVPESSVLRLRGEIDPRLAAHEYEQELQIRAETSGETIYEHDLILLGLGEEGHTASLFPGTAALQENQHSVVANYVPKLASWRLTFTFPLILAARGICFLVADNKSRELLQRVFAGDKALPAARVDAEARRVSWLIGEP